MHHSVFSATASSFVSSRFAKYYQSEDGTERRTLHKAKAIRFEIIVSGNVGRLYRLKGYNAVYVTHMDLCMSNFAYLQAGKFNTVPFLINLVAAFTSVGLVRQL